MEDEKLLPQGEFGIEVTALPVLQTPVEPKPAEPAVIPVVPAYVPPAKPSIKSDLKLDEPVVLPTEEEVVIKSEVIHGVPSQKQQQWGVVISIVVIVLMVIVGAFYAWGARIAQNQYPAAVTQ